MTRRAGLLLLLALSGLFLYLWPALSAPVVLWSDSEIDLEWARRGVGIVSPVPPAPAGEEQPAHPAKPAYLLFLRTVLAVAPVSYGERAIVVVQSLLLWISIAGTSLFVGSRRGWRLGVSLYLLLLLLLRVRDSASAVMPEALAAALLLPIAARFLDPPRTRGGQLVLGLAVALLFWVRPNVGGVALLLVLTAFAARREWRAALPVIAGFAILFLPVWLATRSTALLRGLSYPILEASLPYGWTAGGSLANRTSPQSAIERNELDVAMSNWKAAVSETPADTRRDLIWRALHGLFGTEFYDSRWSAAYSRLTEASRVAFPLVILAAAVFLLRRSPVGALLLILLVLQNLGLGSRPRFVLPFLPALLLLALATASDARNRRTKERLLIAGAFALSLLLIATQAHILDREWGRIEEGGIAIRQRIPRGSLPKRSPATLHLRIAPPKVPSSAHLMVLAPDGTPLYRSEKDAARSRPAITIPLPQSLLDANAAEATEIKVVSLGSYGDLDYLLFPVIPRPWRPRALRDGSRFLSPSTSLRSGSFDWWAHAGLDPVRPRP